MRSKKSKLSYLHRDSFRKIDLKHIYHYQSYSTHYLVKKPKFGSSKKFKSDNTALGKFINKNSKKSVTIQACADDGKRKQTRKRKRRKQKKKIMQGEASLLKRRAQNLLTKIKMELNLIEAYAGDGWNGQSKEKIRPEKELLRAEKQIMKCKFGLKDVIRRLDMLSSEGRIEESVMSSDGSVFHEHIFCAKCKLGETLPNNDIILCDGTCDCAFHQKCMEPPLEKIPPADEGWLCENCECKQDILETINEHMGANFSMDDNWEDIFKEATACLANDSSYRNYDEEWPSEDSDDEDYDPKNEETGMIVMEKDNTSSEICSGSLFYSSDEDGSYSKLVEHQSFGHNRHWSINHGNVDSVTCVHSNDCSDPEMSIASYRRKRRYVDYKKLHDEMFGKDINEQQSEDEDWGPQGKKRRKYGTNSVIDKHDEEIKCSNMIVSRDISCRKKMLFRIPPDAVEKLRQEFSVNELPSRATKDKLAVELGISADRISKWFTNARYAAIKIRKGENNDKSHVIDTNRSIKESDEKEIMDGSDLLPLSSFLHPRKSLKRKSKKKKKNNEATDVSSTDKIQSVNDIQADEITKKEQLHVEEIEKLLMLEERIQVLKNKLQICKENSDNMPDISCSNKRNVMYIPVIVDIKEKPLKHLIVNDMQEMGTSI